MRKGMTIIRRSILGGAALVVTGGVVALASPAAADQADVVHLGKAASRDSAPKGPGYSEIQNRSGSNVRVERDWCGEDTSPSVGGPSCKDSPQQSLKPGEHSYESAWEDTDTFKVKGGCTMKVQWNWDGEENADMSIHSPKRTTWYKVYGHHDIDIESYKC